MPRRPLFSPSERASLLRPPEEESELSRHYSFSETDLALIGQRRGESTRLGFAVQLCLLGYPGQGLLLKGAAGEIPARFLHWIGSRLKIDPACWSGYFLREATLREHLIELRAYLELRPFVPGDLRQSIAFLTELEMRTDKGTVIAAEACAEWRRRKVMIPPLDLVERICAAALTRASRRIRAILASPLSEVQRARLDIWLEIKRGTRITWLSWLRQSPVKSNSRHMMEHMERLREFQSLGLPDGLDRRIHQNRLLKMAREGGQMTSRDLGKL